MQDSFDKELGILREMGEKTFVLRGSTLIVEIQEPEEIVTKGGLIVASHADHKRGGSVDAHRVEICKVLMSGQGYYVDAAENFSARYEPLECQPGAIIVLPQFAMQPMSHFPGIQRPTGNKLAMIKMDQVLAYYPSQEAYDNARQKLNV